MRYRIASLLRIIADRLAPEYRTITWPEDISWNNASPPGVPMTGTFMLKTEDHGRTWTGQDLNA